MMNLSDLLMVEAKSRMEADAAAAERKAAEINACRAEMGRALELLAGWEFKAEETVYTRNEGQSLEYVQMTLDSPTFGRFYLVGAMTDKGPVGQWRNFDRYSNHHPKNRVQVLQTGSASSPAEVGKFFADLRDEQAEATAKAAREEAERREKQRLNRVAKLRHELLDTSIQYDRFPDGEQAAALLAELAGLVPAEEVALTERQWQARWKLRQEYLAALAADEAAEQQARAEYKLALDGYKAAYRAWHEAATAVRAANKAHADELQVRFNEPFGLYRLVYAIGIVEEGDKFVEERSVECLAPAPGGGRHWEITSGGRVKNFWYNPALVLKIGETRQTTPLEYHRAPGVGLWQYTGQDDDILYYAPGREPAEAAAALAAVMQAVPAEPEPPEGLRYEDVKSVRGQVMLDDDSYRWR